MVCLPDTGLGQDVPIVFLICLVTGVFGERKRKKVQGVVRPEPPQTTNLIGGRNGRPYWTGRWSARTVKAHWPTTRHNPVRKWSSRMGKAQCHINRQHTVPKSSTRQYGWEWHYYATCFLLVSTLALYCSLADHPSDGRATDNTLPTEPCISTWATHRRLSTDYRIAQWGARWTNGMSYFINAWVK